jgi:hypothetical protein
MRTLLELCMEVAGEPPSPEGWERLASFAARMPLEDVEHVETALAEWPDELRVARDYWVMPSGGEPPPPALRLARQVKLVREPLRAAQIEAMVASGHVERLTGVELVANGLAPSSAEVVKALARLPELRTLKLAGDELDENGLEALVDASGFERVTRLSIGGNPFEGEALARLGGGLGLRCVTFLDLSNVVLHGGAARSLARSPQLARLEELLAVDTELESDDLRALLLGNLPALWRIILASNRLGDEGLKALADAKAPLAELDVSGNQVGPEGVDALTAGPVAKHLRCLNLAYGNLGDRSAEILARRASLARLEELDISGGNLTVEGIEAIVGSSSLGSLRRLTLGDLGLDDNAVERILATPGVERLQELRLPGSDVTPREEGSPIVRTW